MAELPLLPLPGTVFFPHTLLPLHVYEERYRQLTEHALEGHAHIGVVCCDPQRQSAPVPRVAAVAGVGRIVHHERLAGGRFHLLLQGVARAELVAELSAEGRLYRRAVARALHADDGDAAIGEVQELRSCYQRLLQCCPDAAEMLGELPSRMAEPCVLADIACAALLCDTMMRQQALAERSVVRRLRCANEALGVLLLNGLTPTKDAVN